MRTRAGPRPWPNKNKVLLGRNMGRVRHAEVKREQFGVGSRGWRRWMPHVLGCAGREAQAGLKRHCKQLAVEQHPVDNVLSRLR